MQVRVYKHQPFARCDTCHSLDEQISLSGRDSLGLAWKLKTLHLEYVASCRAAMLERAHFARAHRVCPHPDWVLYINADGMDQQKTNIPNPHEKTKGGEKGLPVTTKLLGAIAYGRRWYGFWSFPQWGATANLTLTALCHIIREVQREERERGGQLPRKLQLQMDNSGRDNKNHYLLGFAGQLLSEGLFDEVEVYFLPVGHTHNKIDGTFSRVAHAIAKAGALSMPELMERARTAWSGTHAQVGTDAKSNVLLEHVLDFRRALRYGRDRLQEVGPPVLHSFSGLGTERGGGAAAGGGPRRFGTARPPPQLQCLPHAHKQCWVRVA